ncbi:NUDIX hydrolase [Streptomyces sp. NPDC050636]|uniref:NUDIX hydrolase n=1 Tax=Streptomyces sp. NPDC050636 TaxID=3154510 RepID=UPI0034280214
MTTPQKPIRAAGCVLWRHSPSGEGIELALVHRPKWADWSHPKGKLKRGEDARQGAVREVLEETGVTCDLGPELPTARYQVEGRPKEVRYWAAEATGGSFEPNREVDRMLWLPPAAACSRLTQARDKELVAALVSALHVTREGL